MIAVENLHFKHRPCSIIRAQGRQPLCRSREDNRCSRAQRLGEDNPVQVHFRSVDTAGWRYHV